MKHPTILTVSDRQCKWIEDSPATANSPLCGRPVVPGSSFCESHHRRCFVKPEPRTRKPADYRPLSFSEAAE
jgi:hypothetical protein